MRGKHTNPLKYGLAWAYRKIVRAKLGRIVSWEPLNDPVPGCTAVIGMVAAMPDVLLANLTFLKDYAWPELSEVIAVTDVLPGGQDPALEQTAREIIAPIPFRLVYRTPQQYAVTRRVALPYANSWLSWCVGLGLCKTRVALLHDYDALIVGDGLGRRYREFAESGGFIQGIRWYAGNGVEPEDRLATTFEAFVDVPWTRRFHPIRLFNEHRVIGGRSIDYDTLLDVQHRDIPLEARTVSPMGPEDLVHPSQMICQYAWFQNQPGKALPCSAIPMIPFFESLHAGPGPLERSIQQIRARQPGQKTFAFLRDNLLINFSQLNTSQVDWDLKQMVQACLRRGLAPQPQLYTYGEELYEVADTPPEAVWSGDFTPEQREWIELCRNPLHASQGAVSR